MVSLLSSQGVKSCKSRESFSLSILTIYTTDWSTFWYVYWCHVYFFFFEISGSLRLGFYGSGIASLWSWLGTVKAGWLGSIQVLIFLQITFIIFQGCPIKQAVILNGQPNPYNQFLTQPRLLVSQCYLHKMLKLGFRSFKPIFIGMQFSLVATFFSPVLVISLSWYFYLTISYLILWKPNGQHLKGDQWLVWT